MSTLPPLKCMYYNSRNGTVVETSVILLPNILFLILLDILLINCMVGDDRRRDWDGVLSTLSETIQFKSRADANNWRDAFENMQVYMQVGTAPSWKTSGRFTG